MVPTNGLLSNMLTLQADDTSTLAAGSAPKVHLSMTNFTPGGTLTPASFTEATYTGYAAISIAAGSQQVEIDPVTLAYRIRIVPPTGGWHFPCTTTPGTPQTIYGFYLTDNAGTVLYGCELLPTPQVINVAGQAIDLPAVAFNLVPAPMS